MQSNIFGSMILGTIANGQGSIVAAAGMRRVARLRSWVEKHARGVLKCLARRYALELALAPAAMTPVTCRVAATRLDQRRQRWMPGVVVDTGTVGDC